MRKFREGGYNTLVATCVGEEGLDIGEVDLIVCFDAPKSPIRLVQRLGRTGRRRSGRIVMIVSEGKEDQVYKKSQSSKNSIHKAIREGCKKLEFFLQRCPRMVPRHVNPQAHKMHMTVDAFVPTANGKRKNGTATSVVKSKSSAANFFKGKQRAKHAFLNDQELACWSEELSLSDREFRAVERSVEKCFAKKMPFLSTKKLAAKEAPQSSQTDFDFIQPNDKSANTSVLSSKMSLSLSKWIHFQTAPVPTKVIGHSSTTALLTSCLEFSDLLKISEGMGASYDLEMRTFLDHGDVGGASDEAPSSVKVDEKGKGKDLKDKRKGKKPMSVFVDSSDDDDFVIPAKEVTAAKGRKTNLPGNGVNLGCGDEVMEETSPPCEELNDEDFDEGACSGGGRRNVVFTASQHVVPRAPTGESLDWLDDLEPSQSQPLTQHDTADAAECEANFANDAAECKEVTNKPGHTETSDWEESGFRNRLDEQDAVEVPDEDFVFVSPKPPPRGSKTADPPSCSTPKTGTKTPISLQQNFPSSPRDEKSYIESVDMFDDLSPQALFDDFSVCLQGTLKSNLEHSTSSMSKLRSTSCHGKVRNSVKGSETPPTNITVICESDMEDDPDKEEMEAFHSPERTVRTKRTSVAQRGSPECSKEESYVLHHQRRKQRKMNFLESPQNEALEDNEPAAPHGSKTSTPVSRGKSRQASVKRVVIDLDPSDDEDFQVPLMKRLRGSMKNLKSDKHATTESSRGDASSAASRDSSCAATAWHSRNSRGTSSSAITRSSHNEVEACSFIEEEAELSHGECTQNDQDMQEGYNMDDSFINDNSMLTQYTQALPRSRKVRSSGYKTDMYKQSLISPKDKLFAKRKGRANEGRFRMVLSQRHQILNHYMDKAGFHQGTADNAERGWYKKRKAGWRLDASSSGSEAEEKDVAYGEEDMEELSQSLEEGDETADAPRGEERSRSPGEEEDGTPDQTREDSDQTDTTKSCPGSISLEGGATEKEGVSTSGRKQKAGFLSDSDIEEEMLALTSPVVKADVSAPQTCQSSDLEPRTLHTYTSAAPVHKSCDLKPRALALQTHRSRVRMSVVPRSRDLEPRGSVLQTHGSCDPEPQDVQS